MFSHLLTGMGLVVDAVESGERALTVVSEADLAGMPYALVVMDWQMPGLDGLTTARLIEAMDLREPPRKLLVSAFSPAMRAEDKSAGGISAFLAKPVAPSTLFNAVVDVFDPAPCQVGQEGQEGQAAFDATIGRLSRYRDARILLVEDNLVNQEVAKDLLLEAGLNVDVADNGQMAVDLVRLGHYDVILMDMQMPIMDGLDATRAIHALPGRERLPILAMTANAFEDDRKRCMDAGMCDHVAKPVDPDQLYQALLRWLPATAAPVLVKPVAVALDDGALRQRFLEMDGLDVAAGLKTLRNKFGSYVRLLGQFARHHRDDAAQVRLCIGEGRLEEARHLIHALKGAAGNLGVKQVHQQALDLELAIRDNRPEAELLERSDVLEAVLDDIASSLVAILPPPEEK